MNHKNKYLGTKFIKIFNLLIIMEIIKTKNSNLILDKMRKFLKYHQHLFKESVIEGEAQK